MPKKIITDKTLPRALSELDSWKGKLTWESYAAQLANVFGEERISRYTLMSYPVIVEAFNSKKRGIRQKKEDFGDDITLEFAKQQVEVLEAKVKRLESQNSKLLEQFTRWLHNSYMSSDVDMKALKERLDKPLPGVNRR